MLAVRGICPHIFLLPYVTGLLVSGYRDFQIRKVRYFFSLLLFFRVREAGSAPSSLTAQTDPLLNEPPCVIMALSSVQKINKRKEAHDEQQENGSGGTGHRSGRKAGIGDGKAWYRGCK